jgi:uroporphyrinogen-III synthase
VTRILVTRPAGQAHELIARLEAIGIDAVSVPTVAIEEAPVRELDRALENLNDAAWLVVTSVNGADALRRGFAARDARLPATLRVAAVGPETAAALTRGGIRVDHVPAQFLASAIAVGLGEIAGRIVVLARSNLATSDLVADLRGRGARVKEIVAYRTVEGPADSRDLLRTALAQRLDGITFASGSSVRGLLVLASDADAALARALPGFCIGPVTAEVARKAGFAVPVVAADRTAGALAAAIHRFLAMEVA